MLIKEVRIPKQIPPEVIRRLKETSTYAQECAEEMESLAHKEIWHDTLIFDRQAITAMMGILTVLCHGVNETYKYLDSYIEESIKLQQKAILDDLGLNSPEEE